MQTVHEGSIPGWGRFLGEGSGNLFQYFYLENAMNRGAWWVHGVSQSWTWLKQLCIWLSNAETKGKREYLKICDFSQDGTRGIRFTLSYKINKRKMDAIHETTFWGPCHQIAKKGKKLVTPKRWETKMMDPRINSLQPWDSSKARGKEGKLGRAHRLPRWEDRAESVGSWVACILIKSVGWGRATQTKSSGDL